MEHNYTLIQSFSLLFILILRTHKTRFSKFNERLPEFINLIKR